MGGIGNVRAGGGFQPSRPRRSSGTYHRGRRLAVLRHVRDSTTLRRQIRVNNVMDVKAPLLQMAFKKTFSKKVVHVDEKFSIKFKGAQVLLTLMEARRGNRGVNARGPWVVRGLEVLAKYIGDSEEKMRKLFESALDDHKKYGNMSLLHIIIVDEIDSVARKSGLYVEDGNHRVLNQFLSLVN
ncbi:vesicle-fusing ATPase-like isoform X2 [Malania oleifera]|uniref:vesicle-fusing ATPase-like isoform X2 n=1 Tax=Malania oleifera TaxID=397392 RepID=UPI0025ADE3AD|nr:vesicle-fusing ATPase-like isoform X2 [Malania oleifera]